MIIFSFLVGMRCLSIFIRHDLPLFKSTLNKEIQYNTRYNALANFVKNAIGGVTEEVVNKNPDLRLELYSLQLYWKFFLTPAFFRNKNQLPCSAHLLAFLISALNNKKLPRVKLLISMFVYMHVRMHVCI